MTASKEDKKFAQVVQKMDPQSKLLRTWELEKTMREKHRWFVTRAFEKLSIQRSLASEQIL